MIRNTTCHKLHGSYNMAHDLTIPRKLWEHPNPEQTDLYKFKQAAGIATKQDFPVTLSELHISIMTNC